MQGDIIALLLVSAVSGDQRLQSQPEVGRAAFLTAQSSTSNNVSPHTLGLIHDSEKVLVPVSLLSIWILQNKILSPLLQSV